MNKANILFIFIICLTCNLFSQDLIIKKDSSKIYCKITKEDSAKIYYKSSKDRSGAELSIGRSEILSYRTTSSDAKEKQKMRDEEQRKFDAIEKIYEAKELKKGLYKSSREFITNSPSVTKEFRVIERSIPELLMFHGGEYRYKLADSTVDDVEILGFCDGKNVYYNYDLPKGFCKMEYVGPYSFFTYTVHGTGAYALIPDELVTMDERGNFTRVSVNNLEELLQAKSPEIAKEYSKEKHKREKRKEYLVKLNEYLVSKRQSSK
ncbi:MAG: hypothetical protein ACXVC6_05815 [Bacteroidia bacterium]